MSHVSKIEIQIQDLGVFEAACQELGLQFVHGQQTYAWYGRHVGDYPLPDGFTIEDMGKCDHAIRVPGARYEIGVVKRGGKHVLLWDFFESGGLERVLGKGAGRLKQAYAKARVYQEAKLKGYHVCEQKTRTGVRLTLTK